MRRVISSAIRRPRPSSKQCSTGIDRGRERLNSGALLWGNVDTYLAWRLSGGAIYATDHGQACATGYYDYFTGAWNTAMIEAQGLDARVFPASQRNDAHVRRDQPRRIRRGVSDHARSWPISRAPRSPTVVSKPGQGKVTYGTSATLDVNTGVGNEDRDRAAIRWCCGQRDGVRSFCIEGMVNTAGAMIDWAVAELGLAASAAELSHLAATVPDTAGAYVLPALQGLGTPHGDPTRRALIGGLTRATSRAHIARAVLEGIAYRVREVRDAIRAVPGLPLPSALRADGGASRSDTLMQIQADVLGDAGRAARNCRSKRARRGNLCRRSSGTLAGRSRRDTTARRSRVRTSPLRRRNGGALRAMAAELQDKLRRRARMIEHRLSGSA